MALRAAVLVALVAPVFFAGCGGSGGEARPATIELVRDSAGVTIVSNPDPLLAGSDVARWSVGEPTLVIGSAGDDGFGLVAAAVWLGDGTIAVGDAQYRHVRFFSPDGAEVATVGGQGGGPGEFEGIRAVWPIGSNELAAWDDWLVRISVVSPAGLVKNPVTIELTGKRAKPTPLGFTADGRLIVVSDSRELEEADRYRSELELYTYAAEGSPGEEILSVPGVEMWNWVWENGTTPLPVPFGRTTPVALAEDAIYVGANAGSGVSGGPARYEIDRYDLSGSLGLRVRVARDPAPLDEARIEAYRQAERDKAQTGAVGKGPSDIWGRMAEDAPYPETLPFYDSILIANDGSMWVRDYQPDADGPSRWTVFGSDGRIAAVADLPARFRPTAIGGTTVLGVARDELDVEYVQVYRLISR